MLNKLLIAFTLLLGVDTYAKTASYYGPGFHGKKTADGSVFNQNAMTTACYPGIKLGTKLKVTNVANGKSVVVKCNDRGSFHKAKYGHRALDLSKGAFSKIANTKTGVIKVKYEIVK